MSSISATTKNALLAGLSPTLASLHTSFPGATGANEVTGGVYAQAVVSFDPASGGIRNQTGSAIFDVPSGQTVRWVGYWSGATWLFASPAGGASPKNFVALSSTDTIYSPSHGWADGQAIVIFNGTPPGGIAEGTIYYVRDAATDTLKIAATVGGTAINMTSAPSWGCVICAITEFDFASGGSFTLESSTIVVPD